LNLLPTSRNPDYKSPQQVVEEALNMPQDLRKPNIKYLRSYYCIAYYYVKPAYRQAADKFAPRARKERLIGYGDLSGRIYQIYDSELKKIIRAGSVGFNEDPTP
ncbi:hypothetical protein B0T26DRAFT_607342, partial [Lasiosphaeria miniovina]